MYSATELAIDFLGSTRTVIRKYGGRSIPRLDRRFHALGQGALWGTFCSTKQSLGDYHGVLTHMSDLVRIDEKIPRPEVVRSYGNLAEVATAVMDQGRVSRDFAAAGAVAKKLFHQLVNQVNGIWSLVIGEFAELPQRTQLVQDLCRITEADEDALDTLRSARAAPSPLSADNPVAPSAVPVIRSGSWFS